MKKLLYSCLMILVFGLCLPVFTSAEMPEGNSLPPDSLMPSMIEGTGTHFEVNNSEYLNIVLDSSETITLRLESVPEMVTMHVEPASDAASTQITISGFEPSTTYYKYEDDYHNLVEFTTDGNGSYSWTQDLSQQRLVFIQPRKSTKFINDNATGGDCYLIGIWDSATKTCTLTTDVYETIQIDSDYITLDGNGHTVTGTGTGYGVYLPLKTGVTVKDLNAKGFSYGIYLNSSSSNTLITNITSNNSYYGITLIFGSSNNTLTSNAAANNGVGIFLYFANNNILIGNNASNNFIGISVADSSNNILTDNHAQENYTLDLDVNAFLDIHCNNVIQNTTGSGGRPIKYFNSSVNLENETLSELILCNADYSNIKNVTIDGSETLKNNRLLVIRTEYSNITNLSSSNNYGGILLDYSSNNTLTSNNFFGIYLWHSNDNSLTSNIFSNNGILLYYSNTNQIYNNNFINNSQAFVREGSGNIFNLAVPIGGNYWSNFDTPAEGCYDTNNDGFCDAPYYFDGGVDYLPWTKQSGWEVPADTIPPTVTVTATPNILWPPNHKMVDVKIDGSATDDMSGIASVVITVTDEYGMYNMTVSGFESTIQLEAWREGTDRDERTYTITVVATDNAGNQSTATTRVVVPHDMSNKMW